MWMLDISGRGGPTYLAVADAYAEAIERGELPPGTRLPPQRDLARKLGVTVGTISRAYAVMRKRDHVSGEVGRGTFVRGKRAEPLHEEFAAERIPPPRLVDLACFRAPNIKINAIIAEAMSEATGRIGQHAMHKYPPGAGLLSHRADGVRWLERYGLKLDPAQLLICGGAQIGLNIALGAVARDGGGILTESTTYAGLLALCALHRISVEGVEIDFEGILPDALERSCATGRHSVLVIQPTLHNPTTASMALRRREEIAAIAVKHGLTVVEDDTAGGMLMNRPPPIAAISPENTIYVTSLSKCLAPALRLGYIAAPQHLMYRLESAAHALAISPPPLTAEVMSVLLASGAADRIVEMNLHETMQRQEIIAGFFEKEQLRSRPGGFFSWLTLPPQWRAHEFVAAALRNGVSVTGGEQFQVDRSLPMDAVRIALDGAPGQDLLRRGLMILSDLLQHHPEPWSAVV